jgi:integrase
MARRPRKRTYKTGAITQVGRRWRYRWRAGGRRYSATAATRELAEVGLASKVSAAARGEVSLRPDPRSVPTLAELFKEWIKARKVSHRDARNDANRWANHLAEHVGRLRPDEVDQGVLRALADDRLRAGLSTTTTRLALRLLSTFFSDLVDGGQATANPVKSLPRRLRKRLRPAHDPKTTPFIEQLDDVRRVFLRLPEPVNIAFAVGALAGLRTGEVLALERAHVDLEAGRIHVRQAMKEGRLAPLKDDDSRVVPLQNSLAPILRAWFLKTKHDLVVPPLRRRKGARFMRPSTLWSRLRAALAGNPEEGLPPLGLPLELTWYQATRHTFASQWVLGGGTLEELRDVMGHSTVLVTERYAHLRPGAENRTRVQVDLSAPEGAVVSLHPSRTADKLRNRAQFGTSTPGGAALKTE